MKVGHPLNIWVAVKNFLVFYKTRVLISSTTVFVGGVTVAKAYPGMLNIQSSLSVCALAGGILLYGHNKMLKIQDGASDSSSLHFFRQSSKQGAPSIVSRPESVLSATSEGFIVASLKDFKVLEANAAFCRLLGYGKDEVIGMSLTDLCSSSSKADCKHNIELLPSSKHNQYEIDLNTKQGRCVHAKLSASMLNDDIKNPLMFAFVTDVSSFKNYTKALEYQALHDEATNLPNRVSLNLFLAEALSSTSQASSTVVFLLDLDDFKHYNDALGHGFGDMILASTAGRLQGLNQHNCQVARVGGDEFAVIATGVDRTVAQSLAERIVGIISQKTHLAGQQIYISASVGIAMAPDHGTIPEDLLKRADIAMYYTKKKNKGKFSFFSFNMEAETQQKLAMNASLRGAILNNEFYLLFQPQVDLETGKIVGVEALLRLKSLGSDLSQPNNFIPALEESGLIVPVGEWIMEHAICCSAKWSAQGFPCRVSINISAKQFQDPAFANRFINTIKNHNANPALVCIEITESTLMADLDTANIQLTELSEHGVAVSIDDFGTGYSSLQYLQKLPVKEIKIDRSFVKGISRQSDDSIIVKTIANLGQSLGLSVVAEGVESACHVRYLSQYGANYAQGFFYSHPLSEGELLILLKEHGGYIPNTLPAELSCPCWGHGKGLAVCTCGV